LQTNVNKKWYQKKRFIIPLGLFGLLVVIGLASDPGNNAVQNTQTSSQQQVKDTITIPAHVQPLEIKQAQPDTATQPQITKPVETPQQTPNYYINSRGNTVQSPTKSQNGSVPAGASARCRDGTYSYSQSRRGTCSHHGGVAQWLY
jgi:hemolysin activation/secretion protein